MTESVDGNAGGPGIELEVPYCDRHLAVVQNVGNAAVHDNEPSNTESAFRDPGIFMPILTAVGAAGALAILLIVYSPDSPVEWFIVQAALIAPVALFRGSPLAAIFMGAWAIYFWLPLLVAVVEYFTS